MKAGSAREFVETKPSGGTNLKVEVPRVFERTDSENHCAGSRDPTHHRGTRSQMSGRMALRTAWHRLRHMSFGRLEAYNSEETFVNGRRPGAGGEIVLWRLPCRRGWAL